MTAPTTVIDLQPELDAQRARRALAQQALDAATAGLIADCGHPKWPGWRIIIAALIALNAAIVAQRAVGAEHEPLRLHRANPRPGPAPTRTIRRVPLRSHGRALTVHGREIA